VREVTESVKSVVTSRPFMSKISALRTYKALYGWAANIDRPLSAVHSAYARVAPGKSKNTSSTRGTPATSVATGPAAQLTLTHPREVSRPNVCLNEKKKRSTVSIGRTFLSLSAAVRSRVRNCQCLSSGNMKSQFCAHCNSSFPSVHGCLCLRDKQAGYYIAPGRATMGW
jgi:hypothetical protein